MDDRRGLKLRTVDALSALVLLLNALAVPARAYVIPEPQFELLRPRGLRISIPDSVGLRLVAFHGNVNKEISEFAEGQISGHVFAATNGRWIFENRRVSLQDNDVVNYWIYAQVNGVPYKRANMSWTVRQRSQNVEHESTRSTTEQTRVDVNPAERILLSEDFDSLNSTLWDREILMPLAPDYEFCAYHNENHDGLVEIKNGVLYIKPVILEDLYGENATAFGKLVLAGCTSNIPEECSRQALSFSILPPIISARLTTKTRFHFRYGKIEIRAKFPEGDWLYPEMWLEPRYSVYGADYSSGRILLGLARGNENLVGSSDVTRIYDGRRLDYGVRLVMTEGVEEHLVSKVREYGPRWTQQFHTYTTIWDENGFKFLVDGELVGQLIPGPNSWLMNPNIARAGGTNAPFDQEFHLVIGVGAGGVRVFPDDLSSSGQPKPWKNVGAKAMLKFWQARNVWLPSWRRQREQKTAFEIDYVRVWSV